MDDKKEVGYVLSIRDYLVYMDGLPSIRIGDLVENSDHIRGVVTALFPDKVEVWILDEGTILPGQLFSRTKDNLSINVGDFLLSRAVNPLAVPIDGKGPLSKLRGEMLDLNQQAPGIASRQFIDSQFVTGSTLIDTLIPLGKGQRELVIGDPHSGKTAFLVDLIVNAAKNGVISIVALIGKPIYQVRSMIDILKETEVMNQVVIVAASSSDPSPLIFYTPHCAITIAEYFQKKGKDVLLILDDLGIHAKVYRQLALLGSRFPGKASYPADIFSTHASLVERAGRFNNSAGGGSITALPVIELNLNDFTTFIPTNLISMTDGHWLFRADLYGRGFYPAIDINLSVSRVGKQTQNRLQNLLAQRLMQLLEESQRLETVTKFAGELPAATQILLHQRDLINELLKQDSFSFVSPAVQIVMIGLIFTNFFRSRPVSLFKKNKVELIKFFSGNRAKSIVSSALGSQTIDELINNLQGVITKLEKGEIK